MEDATGSQDTSPVLSIGAGLPPVPLKLVKRIHAGEFIDMSELLPDRLGINAGPPLDGDKEEKRIKRRQVANILEWVQCFSIFTAVRTQKYPEKTQDMLGYLALIIEARKATDGLDMIAGSDRTQLHHQRPSGLGSTLPYGIWPLLARQKSPGASTALA